MALATITETLELPGGVVPTGTIASLRLIAAVGSNAAGYSAGGTVLWASTATVDTNGTYSFTDVRPNVGTGSDPITSPSGTVYELKILIPGATSKPQARYISVPNSAGPHDVADILTAEPSDLLSPLLDGTTGVAVTFETDGDIGDDALPDWTDGSTLSAAFDQLDVLAGRVVVPDPDDGANDGTNPAAHGVAWRDWSHLGSWTGSRVAVGGWWTGETPMEATPLLHVVETGSDEYGIGVWPAGDFLPGTPGNQPVLLWGYVGSDNTFFEIVATLAFTEWPDNLDLADGRRHHFELRSWDGQWSFWCDGILLTPRVNGVEVGPWLDIPASLLGSTKHGLAVDNNQLDGTGGAGGTRTPNVGAFEGPWTIAPLVDQERSPATAAGVAGSLAYKADAADLDTVSTDLAAHLADTVDAHDATAISYAGGTGISATTVEAAIDELATEKADLAGGTFVGDVIVQVTGATGRVFVGDVGEHGANSVAVYADAGHAEPISAVGSLLGAGGFVAGPGGAATVDTYLLRSAAGVWTAGGGGLAGVGKGVVFTEQSAPSSPAANDITLYAADNGSGTTVLRTKDSAGTVVTLGAGGGGSYTAEEAQDAVGGILVDGTTVDLTYNDGTPSITAEVTAGSLTNTHINASAAIALSKLAVDPLARANHTGTQTASTISDFAEVARDTIGAALVEGEGIDITVNDGADTITIAAEDASDTNKGVVKLGTSAEARAGTSATLVSTLAGVSASQAMTTPSGSYFGGMYSAAGAVGDLDAAGKMVIQPVWVGGQSVDRIAIRTTVAGTATWRVGWYPLDSTGLPDWANPVTAGTIDCSVSTGILEITISQTPGQWVWVAVLVDAYTSNPTVHTTGAGTNSLAAPVMRGLPQSSSATTLIGKRFSGVATGSLPTSEPGTNAWVSQVPRILFRKA